MNLLQGFFPPLPFGFTILDLIIVGIIVFYAWEGYMAGFVNAVMDLFSFLVSFFLALKLYGVIGGLLTQIFAMPAGFANAVGFFAVAFISEIAISLLLGQFASRVVFLKKTREASALSRVNHYAGIIPGVISALIILSFAFSLIVSLPSSPVIKKQIGSSKIGGVLVAQTANFEKGVNGIFGGALHDTLTFLTVEPQSNESLVLHFKVADPQVDGLAEEKMLVLVNQERTKRGIRPLVMDTKLRSLARSYAAEMFKGGYFSHYTPQGLSPFDRMDNFGIEYMAAGENLALAPSTELAMEGLMNSPGHKENLLSPEFGHVGIGAMQGGIYGMMFTQEFTD